MPKERNDYLKLVLLLILVFLLACDADSILSESDPETIAASPGPVGPIGPPGIDGGVGPEGPVGLQGNKGETGSDGPPGPQGATGKIGPIGPLGETGPQGLRGDGGGPVGPQGPKGDLGPRGLSGPPGTKGDVGPEGPRGVTGSQGSMGPRGVEGPKGLQGISGEIGPTGKISGWIRLSETFSGVGGADFRRLDVICPEGTKVILGGYSVSSDSFQYLPEQIIVVESLPLLDGNGWRAAASKPPVTYPWALSVYAICAEVR